MLASILSFLGTIGSSTGTKACTFFFMDEPKMPKSLIEK